MNNVSWMCTLEVKHLSPWFCDMSTGGAVENIWRGWPVPRSFKEPGTLWRLITKPVLAKKRPVFGIRLAIRGTPKRVQLDMWGGPKGKTWTPPCLLFDIIKCVGDVNGCKAHRSMSSNVCAHIVNRDLSPSLKYRTLKRSYTDNVCQH